MKATYQVWIFFFLLLTLVLSIITGIAWLFLSELSYAKLFGESGLVYTYGTAITAWLALLGIWLLNRRTVALEAANEHNREVEREGRFRSGAELMASSNVASQLSGIAILKRLAAERPEKYLSIVVDVFLAFARNVANTDDENELINLNAAQNEAIWSVGKLRMITDSAFEDPDWESTYVFRNLRVQGRNLKNLDLSGFRFIGCRMNVAFEDCRMEHIRIHENGTGGDETVSRMAFSCCMLESAEVSLHRSTVFSVNFSNLRNATLSTPGSLNIGGSELGRTNLTADVRAIITGCYSSDADPRAIVRSAHLRDIILNEYPRLHLIRNALGVADVSDILPMARYQMFVTEDGQLITQDLPAADFAG